MVAPPPEAEVKPGRAWRRLKTLPGLKGGPAAWGHHATRVKEKRYRLIQSARDPYLHSNVRERVWTMRHMDDYVVVGPRTKVKELTEDIGHTTLLRDDVQFLEREEHTYFRTQVGRLLFLSVSDLICNTQ